MLCILIISFLGTRSITNAYSIEGLEGYKLNLENHIDNKLRQAVRPLLEESQFSLNVNVVLKSTDEISKIIDEANPPEVQIEKLLPEKISKQIETDEEISFVELKPTEEETLLPLSKLGLWQKRKKPKAPPISESQVLNPAASSTPVPLKKQLFVSYKDFVNRIDVAFYIEKDLTKEKTTNVEKIVRDIVANNTPRINLSYNPISMFKEEHPKLKEELEKSKALEEKKLLELEEKRVKNEQALRNEKKQYSLLELLLELKIPIALLLCGLIILVLGFYITSNFNNLSQRKMEILEKQADREDAAFKAKQMQESETTSINQGTATTELDEKALDLKKTIISEKINQFINEDIDALALMIRRWITFKNEGYREALNFTARSLSVQQLNRILMLLNDEEKTTWNSSVTSQFRNKDEIVAVLFIESQLLVNIIQPRPNIDEELKTKINSLNYVEIIQIIKSNIELGAVLTVYLQPTQVSKIFEMLDLDSVSKLSNHGLRLSKATIELKSKDLLAIVNKVKQDHPPSSPFVDRIQNLIKDVQIEKEQFLFRALSQKLNRTELLELAEGQFPSELIPSLPIDILRRAMNTIPIVKRAEIYLSQKGERRDFILNLFPEGKNREILLEEVENIELDPTRLSTIERNTDKNWKLFIQSVRGLLQRDESLKPILDPIVVQWIDQLVQSQGGGSGGNKNVRSVA